MKVLIVDDSINKFNDISESIIIGRESFLEVYSVEDLKSAMDFLSKNEIDLLIVDQQIPISTKINSAVEIDGGSRLVNEIERKKQQIKVPKYIIGLTQFPENEVAFSDIWQKIIYSPDKKDWSISLNKLISHAELVFQNFSKTNESQKRKRTIFVEGETDKTYFNRVIELNAELAGDYEIYSIPNAGANWVGQQLIIWGHTLPKDINGSNLEAIGIFDNDDAGNKAFNATKKKLNTSNQKEFAKLFTILPKYSKDVLEYYKIDLPIEIEIESLLPNSLLKIAENNGWLENRSPIFIRQPKDWDQMNETIPDFLSRKGLDKEKLLLLKKVRISNKKDMLDFVLEESKKDPDILINIRNLLSDVIEKIK